MNTERTLPQSVKDKIAAVFKTRTRTEWCDLMEYTDVCFAPVLSLSEAPEHPHNVARGTFTTVAGVVQPAPAPRFSRTPAEISGPPVDPGADTRGALAAWGLSEARIGELAAVGVIAAR